MPRGDGTGPNGMGPMTGRQAGYCAGYSTPGYMNPGFAGAGFGFGGFGRGRGGGGRGRRNWYYATGMPGWVRAGYGMPAFGGWVNPALANYAGQVTPQQEIQMLNEQAEILKQQLDDIQGRVETLNKAVKKEAGE